MRKWVIKGLLGVLVYLWVVNAHAMERTYKIELIVFTQYDETNEVFDQYESHIQWPASIQNVMAYSPAGKSLTGIWAKLLDSPSYHPILHLAWIQRIGSNRLGTAVRVQSPRHHVDGFVRIQRGNLLHFIADIEYQPEEVIYHIQEKRRFKLNEIHYLDHPHFGLIVRILPL